MTTPRAPRQNPDPEEAPSPSARRLLYQQALRASTELHGPQGAVALVLIDTSLAPGSEHLGEHILSPVTSKLASLVNRRLRSVDLLVRSGRTELAVLLSFAHIDVAAAFSERLRQPIEQGLREMTLADPFAVDKGPHGQQPLPAHHLAADHPIERAAVGEFGRALWHHAGGVDVLAGLAAGAAALLPDPILEVLDRVAADAELDEMKGHDGMG